MNVWQRYLVIHLFIFTISSVTELSITEYIRKRHLTIAHKMLCETTESVADICYRAGFNSIQTFHRVFKNTFGMQPLAARERQAKITYRSVEEIITGYLKRIAVEGVFSIEPRFEEREEFYIFRRLQKPHDWNKERELRAEASRVKGFKGKREYPWVVAYQGEVIGQIQLFHFFNHNTCAEVGYFIKKTYWNLGINTKVLKAVCRFGIETMGLERIEAFVHHFPKPKPCEIGCLYGQDCVFAPLAKLCNFGTAQMKAA